MSELKPIGCPCCGSDEAKPNENIEHGHLDWVVACWGCGLSIEGDTKAEAIAAWNRRAPTAQLRPTRDELENAVRLALGECEICKVNDNRYAHTGEAQMRVSKAIEAKLDECGSVRVPSEAEIDAMLDRIGGISEVPHTAGERPAIQKRMRAEVLALFNAEPEVKGE